MTLLDDMSEAALHAGALLKAMQPSPRTIERKSSHKDLLTDADPAAEAIIHETLAGRYPGSSLLLEESGAVRAKGSGHSSLCFVVDPLDGTTNFAAGLPHYAVNIAAEKNGERIAAVTFDPSRDEIFMAERGGGAFVNGAPMSVRTCRSLDDALLVTGFAYQRMSDPDDNQTEFCTLNLISRGVRRFGAAALDLAWTAAGRFDGYWERNLKPWDLSAGILLIEEAGGIATKLDGSAVALRDGEVVTSSVELHDDLMSTLQRARRMAEFHLS